MAFFTRFGLWVALLCRTLRPPKFAPAKVRLDRRTERQRQNYSLARRVQAILFRDYRFRLYSRAEVHNVAHFLTINRFLLFLLHRSRPRLAMHIYIYSLMCGELLNCCAWSIMVMNNNSVFCSCGISIIFAVLFRTQVMRFVVVVRVCCTVVVVIVVFTRLFINKCFSINEKT